MNDLTVNGFKSLTISQLLIAWASHNHQTLTIAYQSVCASVYIREGEAARSMSPRSTETEKWQRAQADKHNVWVRVFLTDWDTEWTYISHLFVWAQESKSILVAENIATSVDLLIPFWLTWTYINTNTQIRVYRENSMCFDNRHKTSCNVCKNGFIHRFLSNAEYFFLILHPFYCICHLCKPSYFSVPFESAYLNCSNALLVLIRPT